MTCTHPARMPNLSEFITLAQFDEMLRGELKKRFPDDNIDDDETTFDFVDLVHIMHEMAFDNGLFAAEIAASEANEKRRSALKMKRKAQKKRRRK